MLFNTQIIQFIALEEWFNTPQGLDISGFFKSELSHLKGLLYGETLLQLGVSGKNTWLQALHYSHKWQASPYPSPLSTLISSFNQLPIDRNSIDCVIVPLVMEVFDLTKSPIDEIDRILKPMGSVVFFGVNPLSLWGVNLRFMPSSCFGSIKAKPKSVLSLQRAMMHRGYFQSYFSSFYYIPPVSKKHSLDRLEILNELGKMISPCPAGFYCLIMQKHREAQTHLLLKEGYELWERQRMYQPTCQLEAQKISFENKFE